MSDFTPIHIALFDELERQGVFSVDVGKLTAAVLRAQETIARSHQREAHRETYREAYQRCEACE